LRVSIPVGELADHLRAEERASARVPPTRRLRTGGVWTSVRLRFVPPPFWRSRIGVVATSVGEMTFRA
jgi:hypothetical protein